MPVGQDNRSKRPFDILKIQTGLDDMILCNISGIIQIDEIIARYSPEGERACKNQKKDDKVSLFLIYENH